MSFVFPQKILFKHCDPAGIVFFPRYFEMINDCVETFFDEVLGLPFEELLRHGGVPTAEISTRFTAPSRHGDKLAFILDCTKLGRTSLGLEIVATCKGETRFISNSTLVYVNREGRPTPWPEHVATTLQKIVKGGE
ncbi:MAG: acyl-CoA thioesterase [Sedimentitalea sp.]|nr:acyl-CoA thioesterase [Sedimentitalea sp.]